MLEMAVRDADFEEPPRPGTPRAQHHFCGRPEPGVLALVFFQANRVAILDAGLFIKNADLVILFPR